MFTRHKLLIQPTDVSTDIKETLERDLMKISRPDLYLRSAYFSTVKPHPNQPTFKLRLFNKPIFLCRLVFLCVIISNLFLNAELYKKVG